MVSELSGIPVRTIQRLEPGDIDNPPIRYLVNLAEVYECRVVDVCEESWIEWTVFDTSAPKPSPKGTGCPSATRRRAGKKRKYRSGPPRDAYGDRPIAPEGG